MPRPSSLTSTDPSLCTVTEMRLQWPDERLVDAVVDDFVDEVVRPTGVGVHARPAPDGLESAQDLDVLSGVGLGHRLSFRGLASEKARGF